MQKKKNKKWRADPTEEETYGQSWIHRTLQQSRELKKESWYDKLPIVFTLPNPWPLVTQPVNYNAAFAKKVSQFLPKIVVLLKN